MPSSTIAAHRRQTLIFYEFENLGRPFDAITDSLTLCSAKSSTTGDPLNALRIILQSLEVWNSKRQNKTPQKVNIILNYVFKKRSRTINMSVKPIIFTPENKPVREFTDAQKQEICRLRETKTPKELAVKFNTQVFRIHKVLNEGKELAKQANRRAAKQPTQATEEDQ